MSEGCGGRATCGGRWGLTRVDVAFMLVTLLVAGVVAAWQWLGVGTPGGGSAGVGAASATASSAGADASAAASASDADAAAGPYAVVQNTEGFWQALSLSQDAVLTVTSDLGTNVIEVADGRVRVREADCANQVCVDSGWASSEGQVITCLPHQLVVQVVATPEDATPLA